MARRRGRRRAPAPRPGASLAAARVELVDPFAGLAQLLALLLDELLQLVDLAREALEEVVDLVDVVAPNPDLEGHRVDGVQRGVRRIGAIHASHPTARPVANR